MNNNTMYELDSRLPLEEIHKRFRMSGDMISRESRMKKFEEGKSAIKPSNRLYESSNANQSTFFQTSNLLNSNYSKSSGQATNLERSWDNKVMNKESFYSQEKANPYQLPNQSYHINSDIAINSPNNRNNSQPQPFNTISSNYERQSPIRISPTLSLRLSPERKYNASYSYESQRKLNDPLEFNYNQQGGSKMRSEENEQFISFFKTVIEIEKEIEETKIRLANQLDFSIDDAYSFFENFNESQLTEIDFKQGMNKLFLYPTNEELRLLISKYDLNDKGGITFIEFFDMLVPFDKKHRDMVEERNPRSFLSSQSVFSPMTINYLVALFRLIISSEVRLNSLKRQLNNQRGLDVKALFTQFDQFNYGHFTSNDLGDYLRHFNVHLANEDFVLLFIRLDRNRDGRIVYRELESFVKPLQ